MTSQSPFPASLHLDGELLAAVRDAEAALMRLGGAASVSPDREAFVAMQLRQEAIDSCVLDGGQVSLFDLLASEADRSSLGPGGNPAVRCLHGMEACLRPKPHNADPGDEIARAVGILGNESGEADPPEELVLGALEPRPEDRGLPEVVLAGLAMGRGGLDASLGPAAGRLIGFALLHHHFAVAVPLSGVLGLSSADYRECLRSAGQSGSWHAWIVLFLRAVAQSAAKCVEQFGRAAALRDEHRKSVGAGLGYAVGKGLLVLDRMIRRPLASVTEVQGVTGTSYVAANTLVSRLAGLGILQEVTGHRRNRSFLYDPFVQVFASAPPASAPSGRVPTLAVAKTALPRPRAKAPRDRPTPQPSRQPGPHPPVKRRPARPSARKGGGRISDHLL